MKLDPKKTAILTLDLQQGILGMYPSAGAVVNAAGRAVEFARTKEFKCIHIGVGFSEGHPEIPDFESRPQLDSPSQYMPSTSAILLNFKKNDILVRGSASAEFDSSIVRRGDLIVYKQRIGAFSESHLQLVLRCQGVDHLVLFGVSTSGVVLSTVRQAFDLDYQITVLSDACFDSDAEVHRVLMEKVFPKQARVTKVDDFISEQT